MGNKCLHIIGQACAYLLFLNVESTRTCYPRTHQPNFTHINTYEYDTHSSLEILSIQDNISPNIITTTYTISPLPRTTLGSFPPTTQQGEKRQKGLFIIRLAGRLECRRDNKNTGGIIVRAYTRRKVAKT